MGRRVGSDPEFELVETQGESIRYLEHGYPSTLVRWHFHPEYELHLIKATQGKVFVGDYIGSFGPGNLILTGPHLPHNWISAMTADESVPLRDRAVLFSDGLVKRCQQALPEMNALAPMLERSRYGIEFLDRRVLREAERLFDELADCTGMKRLVRFLGLLELLGSCSQYRTLATSQYQPIGDESNIDWVNRAVNFIFAHYDRDISLEEVAAYMEMSPTYFSKYFKQTTGHRFIEFVNRLRVSKACDLLAHSDEPVTSICFDVGFGNISNFNRRFVALKGVTPSQYRRASLDGVASSGA